MPKVYSYTRFSHPSQALGGSLRRQMALTLEWVKTNGYELDNSLKLFDRGKSAFDGTNLRTGALGHFLSMAKEGKIEKGSILAIEALDRLTRLEPLEAVNLLSQIVGYGIAIVTVTDGRVFDSHTLNRDMSSLMLAAGSLIRGHEESLRKAGRLQDHYADRRASGAGRIGHAPPGWIRPAGDGWELHPEHSATVREVFELAAKGLGATVIAKRFNAENRLAPSRRKGKGWHASRLSKLLRSKSVIGEYQPHIMDMGKMVPVGPPIPEHYPAAVTPELFWRVQALLTDRAPKGRRTDGGYRNILSGILKCGYCGGTFTLDKKAGQEDIDKFFYSCMNTNNGISNCDNRINYITLLRGGPARTSGRYKRPKRLSLLQVVLEHLYVAGHNPSIQTKKQEIESGIASLGAQRQDCEARKQRLLDAIESGAVSIADVTTRLDKLRAEERHLHAELERSMVDLASVGSSNDWVLDVVEEELVKVFAIIKDISAIDQRAEFRKRLRGPVESISIYREHAMLKMRGANAVIKIPLTESVIVASGEQPVWREDR